MREKNTVAWGFGCLSPTFRTIAEENKSHFHPTVWTRKMLLWVFQWKCLVNKVFRASSAGYSYLIHPSSAFASAIMDKHNTACISATIVYKSLNLKIKNQQIITLPLCSKVLEGGGKKASFISLMVPLHVLPACILSLSPSDSVIIARDDALWGEAPLITTTAAWPLSKTRPPPTSALGVCWLPRLLPCLLLFLLHG